MKRLMWAIVFLFSVFVRVSSHAGEDKSCQSFLDVSPDKKILEFHGLSLSKDIVLPTDRPKTEMAQVLSRLIRGHNFRFVFNPQTLKKSEWIAISVNGKWECTLPLEFYKDPYTSLKRLKRLEEKIKLHRLMVIRNAMLLLPTIDDNTKMTIFNPRIVNKDSLVKWITERNLRHGVDVQVDDLAFSNLPNVFGFSKGRNVYVRSSILDNLNSDILRGKISREIMHATNFAKCKDFGDCEKLIVFESPTVHLLTGQLLPSQVDSRLKIHGQHLRTDEVEGYLMMSDIETDRGLKEKYIRMAKKMIDGQKVFLEMALRAVGAGEIHWLDGNNYKAQVNLEFYGYTVSVKLPKLSGSQNRMDLEDAYRNLILRRLKHLENLNGI